MARELAGQVAMVTGGGRGIGRAIAEALAAAGAAVAVVARTAGQVAETERRFGPVNVLVNNAGILAPLGPLWEVDPDAWWRNFEVNLRGPALCAAAVLPGMVAGRRGRIINIASVAGSVRAPYASAHGAARAALIHLTESLGLETHEYGIRVFAVEPGAVRTGMMDMLFATPETRRWAARITAADVPAQLCVVLAAGRADALSGRLLAVPVDLEDLLRRADEIVARDLYTLRLRT